MIFVSIMGLIVICCFVELLFDWGSRVKPGMTRSFGWLRMTERGLRMTRSFDKLRMTEGVRLRMTRGSGAA